MHPLLARQVRKAGLDGLLDRPELAAFLGRVGEAYVAADEDRRLLEHSLNLASDELFQRNRRLEGELAQRLELRQKLDASAQEVEASERRYQALFELSPVGIVAFTLPEGRVLQSNDMLLRLASLPASNCSSRAARSWRMRCWRNWAAMPCRTRAARRPGAAASCSSAPASGRSGRATGSGCTS